MQVRGKEGKMERLIRLSVWGRMMGKGGNGI